MATDRLPRPNAPGAAGSFDDAEDAEELRAYFETASIGLHSLAADGTILRANRADYESLGYAASEFIGRNIQEFHADPRVIEDMMARLGRGERLLDCPAALRCKDGSVRHVRIDSSALFRDGAFIHTRCFTRDDTARTTAEASLRRTADRLRAMSDALPVLISYVDAEQRYQFNNRAYEEWFGHRREEITGRTVRDVLGDEAYATIEAHVLTALGGQEATFEALVPYKDGGARWIEASYVPDIGDDGAVRGFYAIVADATARRIQDRELEASERRWRTLAEALPATITQHDPGGAITWVNSRTLEYLGIGPDEIGTAPLDVAHPDDLPRVREVISRASAERSPATFEWRARRADGAYRWQVSFLTPEKDGAGNITSWLMTGIDIHDRAVAEDALRSSETRYRSLAEAMTSIIWTTSADARVVDPQEGWGAYTGQSIEQYGGLGWADAVHPDDRAQVMERWAPAMAEKRSFEVTGRIWHAASGDYRHSHARGVPLLDEAGDIKQWVGTLSDIHDQRTAADDLEASIERYRSLTEATSSIVWTTDAAGQFVERQDAWCRYTGQTWESARGSGWAQAFHPNDRDGIVALWASALQSRSVYESMGRIWHATSNEYRYFEARGIPVFDSGGAVREWVGTITDVHERHLGALALEASEEHSRLAAAASRLGTWDWDMAERVRWSAGMEQIYGYAPGEYPGTFEAFIDRVHPDDREATMAAITAAMESGGELDFEHRIIMPDGSIRWLNGRGRVLVDADGAVSRMIGIGIDITEQKLTHQALIEQQERLRRAQQAGRLGTFDWDVRANTVVWDGVEAIHGLPPGAFGGTFDAYAADIHPDDRERVIAAIGEAAATVGEVDIEYRIVWPDSSVHWVNGRGVAIAGPDGATVRVTGTCQDIDERKQADSTLRRQASLLDQITDAVMVWEREGGVVYWNDGAQRIYGYTREEAIGRRIEVLLGTPPEQRAQFLQELDRTGDWFGELRHRRNDGSELIAESRIASFHDAGRSLVLETTRDITERRREEQRTRLLTDARSILTESMEFGEALERLMALLVPAMGEWASVTVRDTAGTLVTPATAYGDERFRSLAELEIEFDPNAAHGVPAVIRTAQPELHEVVSDEIYDAIADAEQRRVSMDIGVRSSVVIPVRFQDQTVAAIELASMTPGRYTRADLAVLQEFGHHAAIALDHARLFAVTRDNEERYRRIFHTAGVSLWEEDFTAVKGMLDELAFSGVTDFRRYLEGHPDFVQRCVESVRIVRVNEETLRMFGAGDGDEVIGSLAEIFLPETTAVFIEELVTIAEGRTSMSAETMLSALNGKRIEVLFTITFPPPSQPFDSVLVAITDISERKHAEQAVRASEEQYKALSNAVPALVVTTLPTGEIETINEAYAQYTGLTVEQARDWQNHQVIHADDLTLSMEKWTHALESGEPLISEFRMRRHDGAYRWHLVHGVPMAAPDDTVARWVTVSVDIDDRKRAEEDERFLSNARTAMAQSLDYGDAMKLLMDLLVPHMGEWASLALTEPDGTIRRTIARHSDEAFAPLSEARAAYNPDAATGTAAVIRTGRAELLTDIPEEAYAAFAGPFRETAKRAGARSALIVPLRFHDQSAGAITLSSLTPGRYQPADLAVMEAFAHHAATALDNARLVSDLRETAQHLQRALSAKDEFLGMVSHELKTPITTIFGNAEVLQRRGEELSAGVRADAIGDIRQEAERLHRIIENMLVLSRLERGQELDTEPLLLRRIAGRVVAQHRRRYPKREIALEWDELLVPVLASPEYVEQVVGNLLSNAEKYSPSDQVIEINGHRRDDEMIVRVCDRGQGIPPDEAEAIFTPFYRSARTATSVQGAGIGLAVCKRLIEAQSGRLWVEQREGGGSAFCFALPVEHEPEQTL